MNEKDKLEKAKSWIKNVLIGLGLALGLVLLVIAWTTYRTGNPPPVVDTKSPIEEMITHTTCDIYDEEEDSGEVTIYTPDDGAWKAFPFQLGGTAPTELTAPQSQPE